MNRSIKHRSRDLRIKDWTYTESSNLSKGTETTLHSKSSTFVSRYSINKDIQTQKLLSEELRNHGKSIVYNFKYKNIMQPQTQIKIFDEDTSSTQNYNLSTGVTTERKYRIKLSPLDNLKEIELDNDNEDDKTYTSQLKDKIRAFLQPSDPNDSKTALTTFESEISQLKEKQGHQREMIFKALKTSEADMFQEKLVYLTKKNLGTSTIKRIIVPNIQTPLRNSGLGLNQIRINNINQTARNKKNPMDTILGLSSMNNMPQVAMTSRTNLTMKFPGGSPTKKDSKLQSIQDINTPHAFKQKMEEAKRVIEGQFSPKKVSIRVNSPLFKIKSSSISNNFSSHILNQSLQIQEPESPSKKMNQLLRQRLIKIIKHLARKIERLNLTLDEVLNLSRKSLIIIIDIFEASISKCSVSTRRFAFLIQIY